jgi:DNA-directed RNA polymerase sigma subunit (sigma70/sigma32)
VLLLARQDGDAADLRQVTRERIRQIEARLKKKLGVYLREQIPDIKDIEFGA